MSVEPNIKYQFSEPFKTQFENLLEGRGPVPAAQLESHQRFAGNAMSKKPPSIKQLAYLKKLGVHIVPGTMAEASALIDNAKR